MKIRITRVYEKELTEYTDNEGNKWADVSYADMDADEVDRGKYTCTLHSREMEDVSWPIQTADEGCRIDYIDGFVKGYDLDELGYAKVIGRCVWEVIDDNGFPVKGQSYQEPS